jgi:hypothetical protein
MALEFCGWREMYIYITELDHGNDVNMAEIRLHWKGGSSQSLARLRLDE